MSTFWDSIKAEVKAYPSKTVTIDNVWDSIPEQSLAELSSDCVHYFIIPTGQREVIGQCKECKGERWFKNYYTEQSFNKTPLTAEQVSAEKDMTEQGIRLIAMEGIA